MKKILMVAVMAVVALTANAQNEIGQVTLQPKVGLNLANMTGDVDAGFSKKIKPGLTAGVEMEYGVAQNFSLTAGVMYSMEGTKVKGSLGTVGTAKDISASVKMNLDYINIPIMAQYYVVPGLAVKAGIQPAINVRKKLGVDVEGTGVDSQISKLAEDMINNQFSGWKDNVKSFALSIPVGLSYEYNDFVLDARYNIGVTKLIKDGSDKNSTFTFTLGYKFEL